MYEDLVTTKMDLFIDEEYWVEKGKEEINLASSAEPENEGFFSFILRLVRPGWIRRTIRGRSILMISSETTRCIVSKSGSIERESVKVLFSLSTKPMENWI